MVCYFHIPDIHIYAWIRRSVFSLGRGFERTLKSRKYLGKEKYLLWINQYRIYLSFNVSIKTRYLCGGIRISETICYILFSALDDWFPRTLNFTEYLLVDLYLLYISEEWVTCLRKCHIWISVTNFLWAFWPPTTYLNMACLLNCKLEIMPNSLLRYSVTSAFKPGL